MNCPNCGNEVDPGKKFCTNCGAPLGAQAAQQGPPVPPPPAPGTPYPGPGGDGKKKTAIIIAVIVGLLVIAGVVAGVIVWQITGGDKLTAEITGMELKLSNGREADLDDVPIDEDLTLDITLKASYGDDGDALLLVTLLDGSGEEVWYDTYPVKSSDKEQTYNGEFTLYWSEGETFTAIVELEAERGDQIIADESSLDFYVAEGMGAEKTLELALKEAEKKLDEATEALADIITMDIETEDLVDQLIDTYDRLETAETEEEAASIYQVGESVIAECAARKAAYQAQQEQEQRTQEEAARQADIAACKQAMFDYAWQTMTQAEPIRIDNFSMNAAGTEAAGTMVGMVTAHTDPDNAGDIVMAPIRADKQGGQWVAYFI